MWALSCGLWMRPELEPRMEALHVHVFQGVAWKMILDGISTWASLNISVLAAVTVTEEKL